MVEAKRPSMNWYCIDTLRFEGQKVFIYEHCEKGDEAGFMIAQVGTDYYKIPIDGFDRFDYEQGYYTKIHTLSN